MSEVKENPIIELKNVSFSYNSTIPVLTGVNAKIYSGQCITIVGPNGGGKSTLLKLILGLLHPQCGEIFIDGQSPRVNRKIVGYVPQHATLDKSFPITVFDVVLSGRIRPFGYYTRTDKQLAYKIIEELGLSEFTKRHFFNLSGGQMQRVLIARALIGESRILMLDEPTSNIDSKSGRDLTSLLQELKSKNMTILLVTHDTSFVTDITDRVLCVHKSVIEHTFGPNAAFNDINAALAMHYDTHSMRIDHNSHICNCGGKHE